MTTNQKIAYLVTYLVLIETCAMAGSWPAIFILSVVFLMNWHLLNMGARLQ